MNQQRIGTLEDRLRGFAAGQPDHAGQPVSIKIRVESGCFHREHSPEAYEIIDGYLRDTPPRDVPFRFEEHESGPELLVYLALGAAGVNIAASVINLVTAVIRARSEGSHPRGRPDSAVELVVRGFSADGRFAEECVLRFSAHDPIIREAIASALQEGVTRVLARGPEPVAPRTNHAPRPKKRV